MDVEEVGLAICTQAGTGLNNGAVSVRCWPWRRHNGVQELLDEQEALRHQLDRATAALKLKLAAEGSRAEELEQVC